MAIDEVRQAQQVKNAIFDHDENKIIELKSEMSQINKSVVKRKCKIE